MFSFHLVQADRFNESAGGNTAEPKDKIARMPICEACEACEALRHRSAEERKGARGAKEERRGAKRSEEERAQSMPSQAIIL